jgi:hypothetical protein
VAKKGDHQRPHERLDELQESVKRNEYMLAQHTLVEDAEDEESR